MFPGVKNSHINANVVRAVTYILVDLDLESKAKETARLILERLEGQAKSDRADSA